jgi:hypothetical protein
MGISALWRARGKANPALPGARAGGATWSQSPGGHRAAGRNQRCTRPTPARSSANGTSTGRDGRTWAARAGMRQPDQCPRGQRGASAALGPADPPGIPAPAARRDPRQGHASPTPGRRRIHRPGLLPDGRVRAAAVLPVGQAVSGGGRMLKWDRRKPVRRRRGRPNVFQRSGTSGAGRRKHSHLWVHDRLRARTRYRSRSAEDNTTAWPTVSFIRRADSRPYRQPDTSS